MTTSARPHTPVSGPRPAPAPARKAATDSYIAAVTERLDAVRATAPSRTGEVADAVAQHLGGFDTTSASTYITLAMPSFEVLDATPAREMIAAAPVPYGLLAATPSEVDEAITALEVELSRPHDDAPTAEIPALAAVAPASAPAPVLTRAEIHGSRRHHALVSRALLLVAGLVIAWVAVGVAIAQLGPLPFGGYFILSLAAVAVAVAIPRHEGRHARGYTPRHGRR